MQEIFENKYNEALEWLHNQNETAFIKRLIDFTLDTKNSSFFNNTLQLLDWLDAYPKETDERTAKCQTIFENLYNELRNKPFASIQNKIEMKAVNKTYGNTFAIGPIDLTIHSGEIVGLVGENGNGKTTLLRLLAGEISPSKGKIQYHFEYIDLYDLRSKLVFIPQRTPTWKGSVLENLLFTAASNGYKPAEAPQIVQLYIARLGLRAFAKHAWSALSSGYKMRFELVRMLLQQPEVLLVDEPLSNLDIISQQTILEDLKNIVQSPFYPKSMVLSSQQLYEVEKTASQIVFIKNGKLKNLQTLNAQEHYFMVELETNLDFKNLKEKLSNHLNLLEIKQNGGVYILSFDKQVTMPTLLQVLINENIPVQQLRDISQSSRRFFVH